MARVKSYEFKRTRFGMKLIIWRPAGRGGKAVSASFVSDTRNKPGDLIRTAARQGALPDRLLAGWTWENLPIKP